MPASTLVADLPNDQKKMVQILKAISREARILLLDEPTSSLTDAGVRIVLRLIRELAGHGVGIVFISHYLSEVFEVADDITVLRDGALALSSERSATTLGEVVAAMIGRQLAAEPREQRDGEVGAALLEVRGLTVRNGPRDVCFTLHKGEVLGVTGLTGSGLTELAKAIFASPDVRRDAGEIYLDGKKLDALRAPGLAGVRHRAPDQRPAARRHPAGKPDLRERGPAGVEPVCQPQRHPRPAGHD